MKDSILTSIKKLLGIAEDCTDFDEDITLHINTTFMILNQLGIGPKEGFRISNKKDVWDDFIEEEDNLEGIKTYMYLKVKMVFDPPLNSATIQAYNDYIKEFEWRLNVKVETDS